MRQLEASAKVICPIVAVNVINPKTKKEEKVYCLLDSGANKDYFSVELAERIGLKTRGKFLPMATVNEVSYEERLVADLQIKSLDGTYEIGIEEVVIGDFAAGKETTPPAKQNLANFDHVKDLPFINLNAKVECLLGSAHIASWFVGEPIIGRKNEPIGLNTNFGWTTAGVAGSGGSDPASVAFLSSKEGELKEQLERLFTNDFPVIKDDKKEHSK